MSAMKKIFSLIIAIGLLASCEVLDVKPKASIGTEDAITNRSGVEQALTGCYDAMQYSGYYGRNFIITGDLTTDNAEATGTIKEYGELANNNLLADNVVVEGIWNDIYTAINRVNNVLYYLPDVEDITTAERDNFEGQLRFLRALHHFNLMRLFGEVPLKTTPSLSAGDELNVPRAGMNDIYNSIITDLEFAGNAISAQVAYNATSTAATALLARVYLQKEEWQLAIQKATEVIDNSGLSLETDYADLFIGGDNSEAIFYVNFNEQDKNRLAEYFLPTTFGGRREISPSQDLISAYEAGDDRKASTIGNPDGDAYGMKYMDISTGSDKVYVLRLAEMYLVRAEAIVRSGGNLDDAAADINQVRNRATLGNTAAATADDLLLAIEQERRVEFVFEGHRWFDLTRTGRALDLIPTVTQECQMLFPIPLSEIQTNDAITPADQNPCY